MFDEKNQEQVVEETLEASEVQNVEKASAKEASTTMADNVAEIADYLNPELFNDVKTLSCLLYTSPSPRDGLLSRMPSSA